MPKTELQPDRGRSVRDKMDILAVGNADSNVRDPADWQVCPDIRRRLVVDLANGMTLLIPIHLLQGLQEATARELAEVEILSAGSGLYWPKLDVDIARAGWLAKIFRIIDRMAELGRAGAKAASNSKRAA